jgi:alanine racemase
MVRPGILLYGYPPDGVEPRLAMRPVMELKSAVVVVKRIREGMSISYGRTWTAPRDTVIGVLPLGYGDGLPRLLSGNLAVIIAGKRYTVVGRICMDQ